ncbi:GGDEF domain-containing protein [Marinobacterium arenosum]|uniref:GGDEF domain-containing protein n=1 Tax=Marinobacterium arenosum TaxID=2862496 RepID=UPI001C96EED3|nr:GGDEF domain-containing protein [Marinobacterium arenosum]MBY4676635.1 GGDEF domain-containing protein [Marinobacterium arenosum]
MDASRASPLVLSILVLCAWLCQPAAATERVVLQLRWLHQAQFIGYYTAQQMGFYREAGFDVEVRAGGPAIVPWQEVMEGRADFAVDNSNALVAYSRGQPLVALAALFQHSPSILLARKDSRINTVRDLIDKRVTLFPDGQAPEIMALLKFQGIDQDRLTLTASSINLQGLIDGRTDAFSAYLTNEPYSLEQAGIDYTVLNPRDYGIDFYSDILLTSQRRLLETPQQVERFRSASLRGWRYALQHPEAALDLLEQHYPVAKSRDHSRYELNMLREMIMPGSIELGHMSPERWQQIESTLLQLQLIAGRQPLEGFLYAANKPADLRGWLPWLLAAATVGLIALASLVAIVSLRRRLKREIQQHDAAQQQLSQLASQDPLTQLPNRSMLLEQLRTLQKLAVRHSCTPALFYIDLDDFKRINETYGRLSGDELLIKFANRVRLMLRDSDLFGRLAGDEFLLISDNSSEEGASQLAMKLMELLNKPFLIGEQEIRISASIGIARYTDPEESAEELLARADAAMYSVKHSLRASCRLAQPPLV